MWFHQDVCSCFRRISWVVLDVIKVYKSWLVVWLPFFIFPYIGLLIIPIDELIFFRGVALAHQPESVVLHRFTSLCVPRVWHRLGQGFGGGPPPEESWWSDLDGTIANGWRNHGKMMEKHGEHEGNVFKLF